MTDYKIVQAYNAQELEREVTKLIKEGFVPSGSLSMLVVPGAAAGESIIYAQAMMNLLAENPSWTNKHFDVEGIARGETHDAT